MLLTHPPPLSTLPFFFNSTQLEKARDESERLRADAAAAEEGRKAAEEAAADAEVRSPVRPDTPGAGAAVRTSEEQSLSLV